jgi:hypothetical protein
MGEVSTTSANIAIASNGPSRPVVHAFAMRHELVAWSPGTGKPAHPRVGGDPTRAPGARSVRSAWLPYVPGPRNAEVHDRLMHDRAQKRRAGLSTPGGVMTAYLYPRERSTRDSRSVPSAASRGVRLTRRAGALEAHMHDPDRSTIHDASGPFGADHA